MAGSFHSVIQFALEVAKNRIADAKRLTELGFDADARVMACSARRIIDDAERWTNTPVTLREASEISGLAYSTLQAMVQQGRLENVGETGSPRVRRGDLPRKGVGVFCTAPVEPGIEVPAPPPSADPLIAIVEEELLAMEREHVEPVLDLDSEEWV